MTRYILFLFLMVGLSFPAQAKELIFGVDTSFPPMETVGEDQKIVGFGPDVVIAAGKAAGFTPVFQDIPWDELFDRLEKRQIDAVLASVTITEGRKKKMDFSDPYYHSYQAVLVRKGSEISSLDDLAGKKVGAHGSTISYDACKETARLYNAVARPYPHPTAAIAALKDGHLDAVIVDAPAAFGFALDNDLYSKEIKLGFLMPTADPESFGIVVRKGNSETLALINKGLAEIKENGEYQKIYDKWLARIPAKPKSTSFFRIPWLSEY